MSLKVNCQIEASSKPKGLSYQQMVSNFGVYQMTGGMSHGGDTVVSSGLGVFYFNALADPVRYTLLSESYRMRQEIRFVPTDKVVTITFSNESS